MKEYKNKNKRKSVKEMNELIILLFCYLMAGFGIYCAAVHESLKLDRGYPPPAYLIFIWPIVYLLGISDVIDLIIKEIRNG